jgi:hypothetical protein
MMKKILLLGCLLIPFSLLGEYLVLAGESLPRYGVIFGADSSLRDANQEVLRFNGEKVQFPQYKGKASIFFRNNMYRSVLLFDNESEAVNAQKLVENYLNRIDRNTIARNNPNWRRGSYVVSIKRWCPKPEKKNAEKISYLVCQGT